jgi:predicted Holliday junction resolvase-like endonuclease
MFVTILLVLVASMLLNLFLLIKAPDKKLASELDAYRKRVESLLEDQTQNGVLMERGSQALENMANKYQEMTESLVTAKQALEFQQTQYASLLAQKKSSEVRTGGIVEQISPFLKDYPLNPNTARFIGDPIDFVHFDEDKVSFVEVKSGKSQLSKKQKHIRDLIMSGKVQFLIYRVEGDGDGTDKS